MINYETILSNYDDKLTLMQWLKKVEAALKDASAVSFNVNNRGNATLTFSVVFEDGSELETGPITLQQGESVTGAHMDAGHLILTLSNGDELDAGNLGAVSGMFINASQHLIVTYQDGTTQDLGAIFQGNVNISGSLSATTIEAAQPNFETNISPAVGSPFTITSVYCKAIVNINILYLIFNYKIKNEGSAAATLYHVGNVYVALPTEYAQKIIDLAGNSMAEASANDNLITRFAAYHLDDELGTNGGDLACLFTNTSTANQGRVSMYKSGGLAFAAGEEKIFTGRVMLTLY